MSPYLSCARPEDAPQQGRSASILILSSIDDSEHDCHTVELTREIMRACGHSKHSYNAAQSMEQGEIRTSRQFGA